MIDYQVSTVKPLPMYRWRVPACIVGFVDVIYPVARIVVLVVWLLSEYSNLSKLPEESRSSKLRFFVGVLALLTYAPFDFLSIYLSAGLIAATIKKPTGGKNEDYDAIDEADDNLKDILNWRQCRIWFLFLTAFCLMLSLIFSLTWEHLLGNLIFQYVLLRIVKQHVNEVRKFIDIQERTEKLNAIKKREALDNVLKVVIANSQE